ncbi:MAG TPA: hypothetical protein VL326_32325 [Kofleriaceae bacterium]|nr:hypothetical protein [Kofleriaceae bacterium]
MALLCGPTGCRKNHTPKDITADLEELAKRACACKDATCAEKVVDDLVAAVQTTPGGVPDNERSSGAASRLGQCVIQAGMSLEKLQTQMQKLQKTED